MLHNKSAMHFVCCVMNGMESEFKRIAFQAKVTNRKDKWNLLLLRWRLIFVSFTSARWEEVNVETTKRMINCITSEYFANYNKSTVAKKIKFKKYMHFTFVWVWCSWMTFGNFSVLLLFYCARGGKLRWNELVCLNHTRE